MYQKVIEKLKNIEKQIDHKYHFICEFVLINHKSIVDFTIKELAKQTYTSIATINRFIRYLNLNSYKEFIYILKHYTFDLSNTKIKIENFKDKDIVFSLYNDINSNLSLTYNNLIFHQMNKINKVCKILKKSNKIYLFAVGGTYNIVQDFFTKLLRLGLSVFKSNDFHNSYFLAKNTTKNDLVIFISYSGETKDLLNLASICKDNEATIFLISKELNNSLSKFSDINLEIKTNESPLRNISVFSRFSILFILDVIYHIFISLDLIKYQKILDKTSIKKSYKT